MIEKIFDKMGIYNIFTNIIPGYVFIILNMYYFNFKIDNLIEQIILAYFIGLTINRIGSITIGKILLKISKENGESYKKYITACNKDLKIDLLLQERNTYRTYSTLFAICLIEYIASLIFKKLTISKELFIIIILIILFIVYSISFCKHNKYIAERVRINYDKNKK